MVYDVLYGVCVLCDVLYGVCVLYVQCCMKNLATPVVRDAIGL